jgi:hypothetical protein
MGLKKKEKKKKRKKKKQRLLWPCRKHNGLRWRSQPQRYLLAAPEAPAGA